MPFPDLSALLGHDFDDVDGNGLTHRQWMANVGAAIDAGTGGAPDDWLSVYTFNGTQPLAHTLTVATFTTADDPPARGTAITFNGTDMLTINEDGRYDVSAKLAITQSLAPDPGGNFGVAFAEILYNNDDTGPGYSYDEFQILGPTVGCRIFLTFNIPGIPITAGQTLQLVANAIQDGQLLIQEAVMTVSRIA